MKLINITYLFTYWIVTWTIFYFIAVWWFKSEYIKNNFNPLLVLIIATIISIVGLIYVIFKGTKIISILSCIFMNFITKIIPIIILWKNQIPIHYTNDFINILLFFSIYYLYLWINNKTLYDMYYVYNNLFTTIINGTYKPIFYLYLKQYI